MIFFTSQKKQQGQTLIEYLIIVSLVGVGGVVIMRSVGQNVNVQFARVVRSLGGKVDGSLSETTTVTKNMYKRKDLRNFFLGATDTKGGGKTDSADSTDGTNSLGD